MKKKIENGEEEKMLNQDRFGFSKELTQRYTIKPRNSVPKDFETGSDRHHGDQKENRMPG